MSPYFASLGSYNSESLALGLNSTQASLADRRQLVRSSWAALKVATALDHPHFSSQKIETQTTSTVSIPTNSLCVMMTFSEKSRALP